MASRASLVRAEPGFSLPFFDRLSPAPPPALVAARLESHSGPGDIVLDLSGRGGWIAHAAIDRQRRAVSIESSPLTRLLAELVLRPPDLRHLDAAFQAMSASPRRQSSLKNAVGDLFATRCATCERMLVADEFIWPGAAEAEAADGEPDPDVRQAPSRKHYRCPVCRGQRGGSEQRTAPLDNDDLERAHTTPEGADIARGRLWDRFPVVEGAEALVDSLLDLHTPRQLIGLEAILERIEGDLRAAPIEAALRLALLHALLPASRLNGFPGRVATLRIQAGRVRPPGSGGWRERNPWLAFEDGMRLVRGFIQRLEGGAYGSVQARLGEDIRSLADGTATAVLGVAGPSAARVLGVGSGTRGTDGGVRAGAAAQPGGARGRVRLVLGQPPVRPNQERLSLAYWATAWVLGRDAASILPIEALSGGAIRAPWGWQATALGRSLASVEPAIARDGRVVYLVDTGGAEGMVAAVLGGVGAGFRLVRARLEDGDEDVAGTIELVPPGAVAPPGPRTRANVALDGVPGGAGDPDVVPGAGLFVGPERFDRRPFSPADAARTVADVAVETIKARGEPARYERLLGEILVGLDRAGQLRRLLASDAAEARPKDDVVDDASGGSARADGHGTAPVEGAPQGEPVAPHEGTPEHSSRGPFDDGESGGASHPREQAPATASARAAQPETVASDKVDRLLELIRAELGRPDHRRIREIEPGRWWLADREDIAAAAAPLADRVEWAVFSLLSTAGPLSEGAFFERIAALFTGHDLPDEALVRACLQSYRSMASTSDLIVTGDDLLRRAQQHAETIARLADGGHRLGMSVWIGRREQARKLGSRRLGDWLDDREQRAYLAHVSRAVDDLSEVDCVWYVRGRAAFLFEVEWTAMLGEPLLRRHARIPQEESIVRFLTIAPERTELVRHKIERSPLIREAIERDNWHVLKWNHLRAFLDRDGVDLGDLEPYLGLDPVVERSGEQLPLFEG